jgi:hypothetical protein
MRVVATIVTVIVETDHLKEIVGEHSTIAHATARESESTPKEIVGEEADSVAAAAAAAAAAAPTRTERVIRLAEHRQQQVYNLLAR